MEQARIDQALLSDKISNISVVQGPITSPEAISPRRVMNIALGIFLGIFGGIGLAFFSECLDHSLKKPRDVEEKLNLPTLASIPVFKK
jgi:capsular polysaccharide biosynthesis protein